MLKRYQPTDQQPWDVHRVVHLHRRAGFAATWNEIQRDLKDGPDAAVSRLVQGRQPDEADASEPETFESMADVIGSAAVSSENINRLKAWWLYRMLFSPDPLEERLTLMWHNHFATSNIKVEDVAVMRRQNDIFRKYCRAPFGELLRRVVKDPAVLVWLDADANRKEHPNENLARELMELFSLGVGNYSEQDVKQVARALTGWTSKNGRFRYVPEYHDDGEKTIFGKTDHFDGDDVLTLMLEHPACARRLAWRICDTFFGEDVIDDASIDALADGLRQRHLDVGWGVETVLRSQIFFDDTNLGNRVLGPEEFLIGAVRVLEAFDPPPSTLLLAEWSAQLGRDLFYPPNVFGWPGGRNWITTRSVIGRANFADALLDGLLHQPQKTLPIQEVVSKRLGTASESDIVKFFCTHFPNCDPKRLQTELSGKNAAQIAKSMLVLPQAQLA